MVLLLLPPNFIRWCSDKYIKNKRFHKSPRVIVLVRFIIISNTWLNKLMLLLIVQWISQTTNIVIGAALGLLVLKPAGKEAIIQKIFWDWEKIYRVHCVCVPPSAAYRTVMQFQRSLPAISLVGWLQLSQLFQ